ncbi:hypothetical protein V6N11_036902 [Hibiscus sabdariffa]|uniref:Uncharacterized protein n=1 Tax=Hibiscus sabdariffa TaxID=183260 RepID=A0ABR2RBR0_9ROSI
MEPGEVPAAMGGGKATTKDNSSRQATTEGQGRRRGTRDRRAPQALTDFITPLPLLVKWEKDTSDKIEGDLEESSAVNLEDKVLKLGRDDVENVPAMEPGEVPAAMCEVSQQLRTIHLGKKQLKDKGGVEGHVIEEHPRL